MTALADSARRRRHAVRCAPAVCRHHDAPGARSAAALGHPHAGHQAHRFRRTQTVYVSNHSSTIDLFALVALGLPNTRFFLSGFLQKFVPLAILARLMGTFFTVPQDRPDERRRIFAARRRDPAATGESVYLSPEGGRITTGEIGPFNKGAFHLATSLGAPIVPLYFYIPPRSIPASASPSRPGMVDVYVKPRDRDRIVASRRDVVLNRNAYRAMSRGLAHPAKGGLAMSREFLGDSLVEDRCAIARSVQPLDRAFTFLRRRRRGVRSR